jgi:hypothetical protein
MKDLLLSIVELLGRIPGAFWGVVIGSFFTLTGIFFTNRADDRRLRLQLKSDRELKDREREMMFRKETYGAAAEAIAISINVLPKLCDLSLSLQQVSAIYQEKSPVVAKVNLVAGEDTILALAEYGRGFATAFLRLTQQRMILDIFQQQIAGKAGSLQGFEKTRDAMIELMRHHNIEGNQDHRRFEAIQGIYEFEAGRIASTIQEIQQLVAELQTKHMPFTKECFTELINVNRLLIPCLVAARTELELSISKEKYTAILNETQAHLEKELEGFMQNIAAVTTEQQARQ